jgi:serine O-acetyltransferase
MKSVHTSNDIDALWQCMRGEAQLASEQQPLMASFFHSNILNHAHFSSAIRFYLSNHLASDHLSAMMLNDVFEAVMQADASIEIRMCQDLLAHYIRDPACEQYITPFLYYKGYHAMQSYRMAHGLWLGKRTLFASYIHSRVSELFDVDIHPAASIAGGIMVDHATGVVIGETVVIEENVSMLHAVTLGGSGAGTGKRHPTIRKGVLMSVGAKILGNIEIGEGTKVGAGSVVLESMPAHVTVAGVPAKIMGRATSDMPALEMDHQIESEHDYV